MAAKKSTLNQFINTYYKQLFLAAFLIILYASSGSTWILLHTFEAQILRASDGLASQLFQQPSRFATDTDLSQINVRHPQEIKVLISYPNGKHFGDTPDGIRYNQIQGATRTEIVSIAERLRGSEKQIIIDLTTPQPPIGTFKIKVTNKSSQTKSFTIRAIDRSGIYDKPFTRNIRPGQTHTYRLKLHKDVIRLASLQRQVSWSESLGFTNN